jgi:murein DD-endopeptidase MepM/ murein hydrolase activator NlpD
MVYRLLLICGLLAAAPMAQAATVYKFTNADGVTSYTDQPVPGARVFVMRERIVERIDRQVRLEVKKGKGSANFMVRNDLYAPVEVELKLSKLRNVQGLPPSSIRRVVPARSSVSLVTLTAQQVGKPLGYVQTLVSSIGDPQGEAHGYRYPFPWRGGPFRLTQGPNGTYSHFGAKGRYAMDIAMPEGTPIIAARGGTVIKVENNQTNRGDNPSGNFVRILHEDGTMGVYLHLMRGSVSVKEGQQVSVGSALARSGNTGNSTGPHLHFVVQRNVGLALESIPYQFDRPLGVLPNFAVGGQ